MVAWLPQLHKGSAGLKFSAAVRMCLIPEACRSTASFLPGTCFLLAVLGESTLVGEQRTEGRITLGA